MRKCLLATVLSVATIVPITAAAPAFVSAAAVPSGFVDSPVANVTLPTAVAGLPDGTVVVLAQTGAVRLIRDGVLLPNPALTLAIGGCNGGERGLLGFAIDPNFRANGFVYLYYTRPEAAPGGCVNRVSRFTMIGDFIDPASEVVLLDNISSAAATTTAATSRSATTATSTSRSATAAATRAATPARPAATTLRRTSAC